MKNSKITTYQMATTALMTAVMCILSPMSIPIGAVPISLANLVICFSVWLLGAKFGTLSVAVYLALGAVGLPVFSNYGAGLAKLAGPTGGYLIGYLAMALIGGLVIDKCKGQPVISGIGLVVGIAVSYIFGTAWFMYQTHNTLAASMAMCVYPFIVFDLIKVVISCVVGTILRQRLTQAGLLHLQAS